MAWIEVTEITYIEGKWEDKKRFVNLDHVCDVHPRERMSLHRDRAEYHAVINFSHHPEKWIFVREDYAELVRAIRLQSPPYATGAALEEGRP